MATLQAQAQIGGYQLIRMLGEGGMGEVWLAQDRLADRPVALKFIKPHLLSDQGFRTRFTNEAKTLGRLEHDRIVTLYTVLDEGDHLALVLRFIDGKSLADRIDAKGVLPLAFVLSCARDILPALDFAHECRIIHRDVKPANILIDQRDRCFLMDFGIAVAAFAERGTMTGFAIGTPHYMSPEQIRTPSQITSEAGGHRSDIYSFGVVLFEMLSGRVPFGMDSAVEDVYAVQHAHCNEPPPPLREINPAVSSAIEQVVMSCLEKDPAQRPQTCLELLSDLEAAAVNAAPKARAYAATIVEPAKSAAPSQAIPVAPTPAAVPVASALHRKVSQKLWYALGALFVATGIGYTVFTSNPKPKYVPPQTDTKTEVLPSPDDKREVKKGGVRPPPPPGPTQPTPQEIQAKRQAQEGQSLFGQGKSCESRAAFNQAVKLDPKPEYVTLLQSAETGCTNKIAADQRASVDGQRAALAEREFQAGRSLFNQGEFCTSKAKLDEAISMYPKPEYIKLRKSAENGCDNQ